MLVLTRKVQQQIHIGNDITITILRMNGQTIRVGIDAPQDVRIVRGELSSKVPARPTTGESGSSTKDVKNRSRTEASSTRASPPVAGFQR